jgi:hypothetical protein
MSGEKFKSIEVHPRPCDAAELSTHLAAFVDGFIVPRWRARWRLNLVEKPERAKKELRGWLPLDDRYCRELVGTQSWPQHIEFHTGRHDGIYFDPWGDKPVRLSVQEASSLASEKVDDAIFSMIPGRLALLFSHESDVWLCKK